MSSFTARGTSKASSLRLKRELEEDNMLNLSSGYKHEIFNGLKLWNDEVLEITGERFQSILNSIEPFRPVFLKLPNTATL